MNKDKFSRLGELVELCVHLLTVPLILIYTVLILLPLTLLLIVAVTLVNLDFRATWEFYLEESGLSVMLSLSFYIEMTKAIIKQYKEKD